jgi:hypothetical protein
MTETSVVPTNPSIPLAITSSEASDIIFHGRERQVEHGVKLGVAAAQEEIFASSVTNIAYQRRQLT